jgi:MinD superfamily P-loop ATPase
MSQLVILSGKGGTGKTSVAASFAHLAACSGDPIRSVLVDADVDAANLELVLAPEILETHKFYGGQLAVIDPQVCMGCGTCQQVCRFDAVDEIDGIYQIDPIACEGCAACFYQCPEEAIRLELQLAGTWQYSQSRYGPLFHAALRPAQENSGKLVALVKERAIQLANTEQFELILIDGPPGIGCPVISAVSGVTLALIVVEPTAAGIHDMHRILETTRHFEIPAIVCVNKADLNLDGTALIREYCQEKGIEVIGEIPFDESVTEAMVSGEPVTAYRPNAPASLALIALWAQVVSALRRTIKINCV